MAKLNCSHTLTIILFVSTNCLLHQYTVTTNHSVSSLTSASPLLTAFTFVGPDGRSVNVTLPDDPDTILQREDACIHMRIDSTV